MTDNRWVIQGFIDGYGPPGAGAWSTGVAGVPEVLGYLAQALDDTATTVFLVHRSTSDDDSDGIGPYRVLRDADVDAIRAAAARETAEGIALAIESRRDADDLTAHQCVRLARRHGGLDPGQTPPTAADATNSLPG